MRIFKSKEQKKRVRYYGWYLCLISSLGGVIQAGMEHNNFAVLGFATAFIAWFAYPIDDAPIYWP